MRVDSSSDQFQLLWSRRDKCTCAWLNSVRNWPTAPGISNTVRVLMCTETCRIPILYSQRRLSPGMENCWSCAIHVEHRCEVESNINCKHLEECPMRCSGRIFTSLRGRYIWFPLHSLSWGLAGTYASYCRTKVGLHPGQVSSSSQGHVGKQPLTRSHTHPTSDNLRVSSFA